MIYKNPKSRRVNSFSYVYKKIKPEIPHFPNYVDIELTNNCNLHCKMCPRNIAQRPKGFMSEKLFKKIVDECNRSRTYPIRLIGFGEPLIHPEIRKFIQYIKNKHGLRLHITTNGLLLTKEIRKSILDWNVDSIIVSMQGLTESEYKDTRGCDWSTLERNLKTFNRYRRKNRAKPYLQITTTVDSVNEKDKKEFLTKWLPLVDAVSIGKTNWAIVNQNIPKQQQYVQCTEVNHLIQVSWDGKVSCCCGDYDDALTIGNVNTESIRDIWNKSERLKCIRELLKDKGNKTLNPCFKCIPTYEKFD